MQDWNWGRHTWARTIILITDMDMKIMMGLWIENILIYFLDFWVKEFNVKVQNNPHQTHLGGNQRAVGLTAFDIT